jgi:dolichol-phosphate mannosyltransferase
VAIVAGFSALQLLSIGILGEYIGRMYAHLQGRPTYFIAYDSLSAAFPGTDGHGPTDTPLPASPQTETIPAPQPDAVQPRG